MIAFIGVNAIAQVDSVNLAELNKRVKNVNDSIINSCYSFKDIKYPTVCNHNHGVIATSNLRYVNYQLFVENTMDYQDALMLIDGLIKNKLLKTKDTFIAVSVCNKPAPMVVSLVNKVYEIRFVDVEDIIKAKNSSEVYYKFF